MRARLSRLWSFVTPRLRTPIRIYLCTFIYVKKISSYLHNVSALSVTDKTLLNTDIYICCWNIYCDDKESLFVTMCSEAAEHPVTKQLSGTTKKKKSARYIGENVERECGGRGESQGSCKWHEICAREPLFCEFFCCYEQCKLKCMHCRGNSYQLKIHWDFPTYQYARKKWKTFKPTKKNSFTFF